MKLKTDKPKKPPTKKELQLEVQQLKKKIKNLESKLTIDPLAPISSEPKENQSLIDELPTPAKSSNSSQDQIVDIHPPDETYEFPLRAGPYPIKPSIGPEPETAFRESATSNRIFDTNEFPPTLAESKGKPKPPPAPGALEDTHPNQFTSDPKFLQLVLDTNPDIIYIFDLLTNRTVYCNKDVAALLSYSASESKKIGQQALTDLIHPEDLPRIQQRRKKLLEATDPEILPVEYRMRHKSGQWRNWLARDRVFSREKGQTKLIIGIAVDITEYRESENERLALAQEHFSIIKNLQSYVFKLVKQNKQLVFEFKEGRLAELMKKDGSHAVGKTPQQLYGKTLGDFLEEKYRRAFGGEEVDYEFEHNGRYLASHIRPLWENNQIVAVIGSGSDITEQKKNMQALRESEEKYRVLVENSPNGIALAKWDGTIIWCNQAAAKVLGYDSAQAVIGKKGQSFITLKDFPKAIKTMSQALRAGFPQDTFVFDFQRNDGKTVPLELHIDLLTVGKNQKYIFAIVRDLSDRVAREIEREDHINELTFAYDSTLEGWAKILEMRDAEIEGHSRRVIQLTEKLARTLDLTEEELVNIRRGAVLHDIGKMAIPDEILLKKNDLSPSDWQIMRQHPLYAKKMLEHIPFLSKALDIPVYHHERWDGQGYPYGLKGEEIPLAARIFAVVDVWDALVYDRRYKNAWPEKASLEYIKQQSGKSFQPEIVDAFLDLIQKEKGWQHYKKKLTAILEHRRTKVS